ncbi:MAG: nucleotidyl transferase AbiEii/AbiGii toxin family protein [Ignavibacteriae bacterium]|nr:nucleotidyl transferase AbiEii/AbiGii toxin family protein [Ignavibacteriota bacterium]
MAVINRWSPMKWHSQVLSKSTLHCLDYFCTQRWLTRSTWYLAGGTGLAMQTGHRISVDLDFFTRAKSFSSQRLINHFPPHLWETTLIDKETIYGNLFQCKVSFLSYPVFIPQYPFLKYNKIQVLDARDIALMKIIAVSQRGKKRDFIDLYWICNNLLSLQTLLEQLPKQFPHGISSIHHILKSLTYFEDAESDPMPKINFKSDWKSIKKFFCTEVRNLSRNLLRLS